MIYDYQKPVYDKLVRTAVAHNAMLGEKLPVRARFHRLVIGESGSGKSYLAEQVGKELNWNTLKINTASWVVLGARETPTWHKIVQWLCDGDKAPRLLILDEVDKVEGSDSWTRYLRAELFDLLDGHVTQQTFDDDVSEITARKELKKLLVFACGAFQVAFETKPTMGFNGKEQTPNSSNHLAQHLQRELVNRFDNELLVLPELKEKDYMDMIHQLVHHLPSAHFDLLLEFGKKRIPEAVNTKSAARFIENVLAEVYYHLTAGHKAVAHSDLTVQAKIIEDMQVEMEEEEMWSTDLIPEDWKQPEE